MSQEERIQVGMIFECGPEGADLQVCEFLARRLDPRLDPVSVPLGNKPNLLRDCGGVTSHLLHAAGCSRVLIIWDLFPPGARDEPSLAGARTGRRFPSLSRLRALTRAG